VIIAIAVIGIVDVTVENVHITTIVPMAGVVDRQVVREATTGAVEATTGAVDLLPVRLIAVPAIAQTTRAEMDAQGATHQIIIIIAIPQTATLTALDLTLTTGSTVTPAIAPIALVEMIVRGAILTPTIITMASAAAVEEITTTDGEVESMGELEKIVKLQK